MKDFLYAMMVLGSVAAASAHGQVDVGGGPLPPTPPAGPPEMLCPEGRGGWIYADRPTNTVVNQWFSFQFGMKNMDSVPEYTAILYLKPCTRQSYDDRTFEFTAANDTFKTWKFNVPHSGGGNYYDSKLWFSHGFGELPRTQTGYVWRLVIQGGACGTGLNGISSGDQWTDASDWVDYTPWR